MRKVRVANRASKFDVFVSYASEDMALAVRDIMMALYDVGITMWADLMEIAPSDSIPQAIDQGITASRYLVPIITATYFVKPWTNLELSAVRMLSKPIIPIWVDVSAKAVSKFSPLLAQHKAILYDANPHNTAEQVAGVLLTNKSTNFFKLRDARESRRVLWDLIRVYVSHAVTGEPLSSPDWLKLDGLYSLNTGRSLAEHAFDSLGMDEFDISERVKVFKLAAKDLGRPLSDEQIASLIVGEGKRKSDTWFPRDPREDEALIYLGLQHW